MKRYSSHTICIFCSISYDMNGLSSVAGIEPLFSESFWNDSFVF